MLIIVCDFMKICFKTTLKSSYNVCESFRLFVIVSK
nr:MAG TPA: hypothetical protein [Caudoviricetes sp.]